MTGRLRPLLVPVLIAVLAAVAFATRVRREMVDFGVYRVAAERVRAAEPLYRAADGHYQFKYLPAFALAMTPFSALDPDAAKAVWFALSVGLLAAFVRWTVRALPERRRTERALVWLALVCMAKFYLHELTLGQANLLMGALLIAALLAVQVDQPSIAGALIGVAALVKPYALVLLPWLGFSYGLGAAGVCLAVVSAGLVLPAFLYGWSGNIDLLAAWLHTVTSSTAPNLLVTDNISFAAMWAKWIGPGRAASALATATNVAALSLVAVTWLRRRRISVPDYLEVALLMLLVPLLSPQGWDYVLLLATPAIVCIADRWSELGVRWRVASASAIALMGFTIFDLMGRALYTRFMALSIVSVAAMGIAATLVHLRWREMA